MFWIFMMVVTLLIGMLRIQPSQLNNLWIDTPEIVYVHVNELKQHEFSLD